MKILLSEKVLKKPFDPPLFVEFRNRMGPEQINAINEKILPPYQAAISEKQIKATYEDQKPEDRIYCSRENRRLLKEQGIELLAKPLGRPAAVKKKHIRPGERNPIEGKFGQAKTAYGLDNIKARLKGTSE